MQGQSSLAPRSSSAMDAAAFTRTREAQLARKRKLYLLIPFLYVGVIALLVYLQFSSGEAFEHHIGELTVRGVETPRGVLSRSKLKRISLAYGGVEIDFTRSRPLLVGPNRRRRRPVQYTLHPDGITIIFRGLSDGEIAVVFEVTAETPVHLEMTTRERSALGLPFESPGSDIRDVAGIPILSVGKPGEMIVVAHPRSTEARWAGGYLYLDGPENRLSIGKSDSDNLYLQWFSSQAQLTDADEYNRMLMRFLDRSYRGWRTGRFVASDGAWRVSGAQPLYSSTLAAALLAEALRRQEFPAALNQVGRAGLTWLRAHPDAVIGGQASPFIGGMAGFRDQQTRLDAKESQEIERQVRAGDPALFGRHELVRRLLTHPDEGLVEAVLSDLAPNADVTSMEMDWRIGLLEAIVDYRELDPEGASVLNAVAERVTQSLISDIRVSSGGLFVGPAPSDLFRSIWAGTVLMRASSDNKDGTPASLGRTIVGSCLSTAGDEGFLPAVIGSSAEGRVTPEQIYGMLMVSPHYPRLRPLGLGGRTWLWSSADLVARDMRQGRIQLRFSFPHGLAHYVLIQGIDPIKGVEIRGIPWRPDPEYYRYAAGWYYESETRSLFVKLTHTTSVEDLIILM